MASAISGSLSASEAENKPSSAVLALWDTDMPRSCFSSFRDAGEARRPGIHSHGRWLWIPGSSLRSAPE